MVNYIIGNISKTLNLKIYKIKKWEKKIVLLILLLSGYSFFTFFKISFYLSQNRLVKLQLKNPVSFGYIIIFIIYSIIWIKWIYSTHIISF